MRKIMLVLLAVAVCAVVAGCAQRAQRAPYVSKKDVYEVDIAKSSYEDKDIKVTIAPFREDVGWVQGFLLTVENKTQSDISIDWAEVYFLDNGKPNGGFMFEGVAYAKRNEPKQPFLVLAKTSNNIRIYPNTRAEFINRWYNSRIENGTYGLYATIKAGKSPKKVKVTMDISENKNP